MERADRLHLISRVCYYLGWVVALVAVIGHITKLNQALVSATNVSGRNLLEAGLLLFLICVASEVRAIGLASGENKVGKGQAA
jgi:ABC-type siderophore export system fused ATPase/permease subunit